MGRLGRNIALALAAMGMVAFFTASPAFADAGESPQAQSIPLVMIVVGFDGGDDPAASVPYDEGYDWSTALFGEGESPASFYRDMSNGAFTFTAARETSARDVDGNANAYDGVDDGIVHVTLHGAHGAWGAVNVDSAVTRDFAALVMEALRASAPYIDFSVYDEDVDGVLEPQELVICICVSGYEGSTVTDFRRDDIPLMWSHSGLLSVVDDQDREIDGLRFESYIAIAERNWTEGGPLETAEQEPLGVVYHELGHALGLPDLYAVTVTEGPWADFTVGALSLMDSGGWQYADDGTGLQNVPTALDGWSRYVLGWVEPTIVVRSGDYAVSSQLSDGGYSQLMIPTDDPAEYYIIENRPIEGQDIGLATDYDGPVGVVAWHVDNGMYKRFYDANQVNDANHRPAVMDGAIPSESPVELLLYNDADDVPEARTAAGVSVQVVSNDGRNATVRVEFADDASAARNALHVLDDVARDDLTQYHVPLLDHIVEIVQAVA